MAGGQFRNYHVRTVDTLSPFFRAGIGEKTPNANANARLLARRRDPGSPLHSENEKRKRSCDRFRANFSIPDQAGTLLHIIPAEGITPLI